MAASAPPWSAGPGVARAPSPSVLWGVALAGCAAAAVSVEAALASDHLAEPGLRAALLDWITLPYILAGLVAWWRRPDSRFGPLMVAAGFVMFLSSLQWANTAGPYTLGLAFDLLPVVLFLHLFLAFPDGRLGSGLRGLADRVEALGGRLRVWTPRGGGTRVRAEMPCE
jgi:hypothetical protein